MTETPISKDELLSILQYDPEIGCLFWKERPNTMFSSLRASGTWNARYAGKEAFTAYDAYGYRQGNIYNRRHKAHRVICMMNFGAVDGDVDHINGVRDDNRLCNLRVVSRTENLRNSAIRRDNTSGHVGIRWRSTYGRWQVRIRTLNIGSFTSLNDAIAARKAAEVKFGFHHNHGRQP